MPTRRNRVVAPDYRARIESLAREAAAEGIAASAASQQDFWTLLATVPRLKRCRLVLTRDGHLRASWGDERREVRLLFLGNGDVRYVVNETLRAPEHVRRTSGRTRLAALAADLNATAGGGAMIANGARD